MAGSWERTNNDDGEYKQYIKETTGPLLYQLDPNRFYNCQECRPEQPGKIGSGVSVNKKWPLVDVESDLKNITRPLTNDPKGQFRGGRRCNNNQDPYKVSKSDAMRNLPSCNILTDETRMTNPACNLRGTGVSQHIFRQLVDNPQDLAKIEYPGPLNSKQLAKDTYANYSGGSNPAAYTASLPTGADEVQKPVGCNGIDLVFTEPLNATYKNNVPYANGQLHVQPALQANYTCLMDYYNKL